MHLFGSHIAESIFAVLAMGLFVLGLVRAMRHPFWGHRLRTMFRRPFVVLFLPLAALFVMVAFLDSISWRDKIADDQQVSYDAKKPRSVLNRLFSAAVGVAEYDFRESSYSAPLATHAFDAKTDDSGQPLDSEKLTYRHLMGTTQTGDDTLFHVLKGAKPAIVIGTIPLLIALPLAMFLGVCAGYFGGRVDDMVVYIYSTIASIPSIILLMALVVTVGRGLLAIGIGLGVIGWVSLCRLVRAETLKLREMEYVQAARCLGTSTAKIIFTHILPNLMHLVIIVCILSFSSMVLSEAILAYLGIGLEFSWGSMVDGARAEVSREPVIWWNIVFASSALFLLVLAVNIIGDAIRDVLDPKITS